MKISVVIPTCNRKQRLLASLAALNTSVYPIQEVIIVDAGDDPLTPADYSGFSYLSIRYLTASRSVCIQRNTGIRAASGDWIYLCDDDIETPPEYLATLIKHLGEHRECGAVSGLVMQRDKAQWVAAYPVRSAFQLVWTFIFQGAIWGPIDCSGNFPLARRAKTYYAQKGNHLSKAGWPVITDFSAPYFHVPVFGLGASLIRKAWLLQAPYDEVLDSHGIGDNYGVSLQFPAPIHVLHQAKVYHHQENVNRLHRPVQYYRRVLAMDYFRKTGLTPPYVKKFWLVWSLGGNLCRFILVGDRRMIRPAFKSLWLIISGNNPYYRAARKDQQVMTPMM